MGCLTCEEMRLLEERAFANGATPEGLMEKAGRGSEQFSQELQKLTGNLTSLNGIYGSMLTAMRGGGASSSAAPSAAPQANRPQQS